MLCFYSVVGDDIKYFVLVLSFVTAAIVLYGVRPDPDRAQPRGPAESITRTGTAGDIAMVLELQLAVLALRAPAVHVGALEPAAAPMVRLAITPGQVPPGRTVDLIDRQC